MKSVKRILKYIVQSSSAFSRINFLKAYKLYDKNASVVIVFNILRGNLGIEFLCWDLAAMNYCIINRIPFRLSSGTEKMSAKIVIWSPGKRFIGNVNNYPELLIEYAEKKECEGNIIFPSSKEVAYLENKEFMHEQFELLGIRTPRTIIYHRADEIVENELSFPLLLKGAHSSGSLDVHKMNSYEDLMNFLSESNFATVHQCIILQELLPIRRDLRVTFIHDEIVLHYWRINLGKDWQPTSTSHGNNVDFNNFPEVWRDFIISEFKKLEVPMGAFDVTWVNDDISQMPYILEFSPRFTPNPPFKDSRKNNQYGLRKRDVLGKDVYCRNQVELIFSFNFKYLSKMIPYGQSILGK